MRQLTNILQIDSFTKLPNRTGSYYRFNLPRELSSILLSECEGIAVYEMIEVAEALTKEYLDLDRIQNHLRMIAKRLVKKHHARSIGSSTFVAQSFRYA